MLMTEAAPAPLLPLAIGDGPRPLVGRAAELAAVTRAVGGVSAGDARMLTIIGEAGIGKSALLAAAAGTADDAGMLVLEGRAAEHERDVPFGAIVDALDDHVATLHPRRIEELGPELAAILPAVAAHADGSAEEALPATAAERFRYHRALRALIEQLGREKPVALLLDDLHWADDASVEFVLHLLRRPPRTACLAVFALRPLAPAPQLRDAARNAPRCEQLALSPLAHEASLALLAGVADRELKERIVREAGGNPLFLEEMARIMRHPAPRCRRRSSPPCSWRCRRCRATTRAGRRRRRRRRPVRPQLAAAAAGLDPLDALTLLDELVAADLLRPTDGAASGLPPPARAARRLRLRPPGWRLSGTSAPAALPPARRLADRARLPRRAGGAGAATRPPSRCWPRPPWTATDTSPATAARWYGAAVRCCRIDARAALTSCWCRWRWRSPTPAVSTTRAPSCARCCRCCRARARRSPSP